jgi:tetratricopeptide (TPR) repeat protein
MNKWGIGALLLGLFTFPGSGTLPYSVALAIAVPLRRKVEAVSLELVQTLENTPISAIQPTIDVLPDTDIETKRLAVTTLSRQGTPEAIQVLRQLVLDPHAEIRTDASIALTHLEERFSRSLKNSLEQWKKNPSDRECMLNLADEYYQYAQSNVLDEASQHFYFAKAYDLLRQTARQGVTEPDLWLKLARVCQHLGEFQEALQAVRVALQLNRSASDAYLLAMELAFSLRDWDSLIAFASTGVGTLSEASEEVSESFRWWANLQKHGEAICA